MSTMNAEHLAALAAANAYDERKERELFEQCMVSNHGWGLKLQRDNYGTYLRQDTLGTWIGWRSCAIARATLQLAKTPAPSAVDSVRADKSLKINAFLHECQTELLANILATGLTGKEENQ
jgi:hypothetical protein